MLWIPIAVNFEPAGQAVVADRSVWLYPAPVEFGDVSVSVRVLCHKLLLHGLLLELELGLEGLLHGFRVGLQFPPVLGCVALDFGLLVRDELELVAGADEVAVRVLQVSQVPWVYHLV